MRCERCQGRGLSKLGKHMIQTVWEGAAIARGDDSADEWLCPDCNGSGVAYCCEGSERHGQLPDKPESES